MRILLADHHPQALWALKTAFQEKSEFEVTGEAVDAEGLLAEAAANPPDLALVDWELPGRSIDDLIAALHACEPRPIIVMMGSKPEYGRLMLKAGADAFVSKGDQPDWLFETLGKFEKRFKKENEKEK
jgi:DNA-binding NarL/FixJ family response regulator